MFILWVGRIFYPVADKLNSLLKTALFWLRVKSNCSYKINAMEEIVLYLPPKCCGVKV